MVKVRNHAVLVLLLVAAGLVSPVLARSSLGTRLAQSPSPPDQSSPEGAPDPEVIQETTPPELIPDFTLPEALPQGTTLTIAGSSSLATIAQALIQQFEATFSSAAVTWTEQPAETALQNLLAGTADLAAIGRPLRDTEEAQGLVAVSVSREKIAIIVSADHPFTGDLEAEDFVRLFRGDITNWQQLGGPDLPVRFVDRPETSDTRQALGAYDVFGGNLQPGPDTITVATDSTAAVVEALGDTGISYAIASQVLNQENVRVLTMHGTLPGDPRYPYSQPRNLVYRGTEGLPIAAEAFLALALNPDGQAVVARAKAAEAADVAAAELPEGVIAMRPNGQGFVTGDRQGNLTFWTLDGTPAGDPVTAHTGPVTALAFSPDGQRLISGGADGTLRFWDAVGTAVGEPINASRGPVTDLVVQPTGEFISASSSGTWQRWDTLGNPIGEPIQAHTDSIRALALTPDGQTLITAARDGTLQLWDPTAGTPRGEAIAAHSGAVQAIAVNPDGGFVSGGADGTVRRWDALGNAAGEPIPMSGPVSALAISPADGRLVVGDETGAFQFLAADGTATEAPERDVGAPVDDLAYTPDGQRLVVSAGGELQLRDAQGQRLAVSTTAEEATLPSATDMQTALNDLWQRLQALPPRVAWLIPIAVLALLVLGVLRSFNQAIAEDGDPEAGNEPSTEATDLDAPAETPEADQQATVAAPPVDPSAAIAGITPAEASASLDTHLERAKQALDQGVTEAESGQYQAALDAFNKAIEAADLERLKAAAAGVTLLGAGTVMARGLARRGAVLTQLGRAHEGLKSFDQALKLQPDDLAAWIGKGNALNQLGQLDEAIFCFDKAIELNETVAAAWSGKGKALQKLGRTAAAHTCLAKARSLGSGSDDLLPFAEETPAATAVTSAPSKQTRRSPDPPDPVPAEDLSSGTLPAQAEDEDVPAALRAAIADLPDTPDTPSPTAKWAPPLPVPPDVSALFGNPDEVPPPPPDPRRRAQPPTTTVSPGSDPAASGTARQTSPAAARAEETIDLSADSGSPTASGEGTGQGRISPVASTAPAADLPESSITPDHPDTAQGYDPALADLPPEVLAALKGIPDHSPDRFNLPPDLASPPRRSPGKRSGEASKPPPPPPSNPRLRKPST